MRTARPAPPSRRHPSGRLSGGPVRRFSALALILLCSSFFHAAPALPQTNRPYLTEDATVPPSGYLNVSLGLQTWDGFPNTINGKKSGLTQFPVVAASLGLGGLVEFQVSGVAANRLETGGATLTGAGDFSLFTKIRILKGGASPPAISFRYGVKLPNASETDGVGTNETDMTGELLVEKDLGRFRIFGSTGIAILGSTDRPSSQDDLFTFGLACEIPVKRLSLAIDWNGMIDDPDRDVMRLGAGLKLPMARFCFDASFWKGYLKRGENWGFSAGVSVNGKTF
jgi:hypothetical protein